MVDKGRIVKVSMDKNGIITREMLAKIWTDWIDYWSVNFDFENKREIIRVQNPESNEWEVVWTGDYIGIEKHLSGSHAGWRKVAVKVVDIFGNDTMTIVEVTV